MNLDEVLSLPKSGVIALVKDKQVLVTYTSSMAAYLETLYAQFSGKKGIEMVVWSAGADIETLKLHAEYYRDYYRKRGFGLMQSPLRRTLQYRVRVRPDGGFRWVMVELVSARGETKSVGRFKTSKEAKDFIDQCYGPDNPFRLPVYAANADTKAFMLEQTKLLDIR